MTIRKTILGIIAAAAVAGCAAAVQAEKAPDFTLKTLDGKTVSLSDYRGKVVFIDFWATWCPPCRQSIPAVEKLYERFKGKDLAVLGINVDNDPGTVRKFVQKNGISYTVLLDDQKAGNAYRVRGIPAFFIIDREGNIAERYVGFEPKLSDVWAQKIQGLLGAGSTMPAPKKQPAGK